MSEQLWLFGLPSCRARRSGEILHFNGVVTQFNWVRWHHWMVSYNA